MNTPTSRIPTAAQVLAHQKADHAKHRPTPPVPAPASPTPTSAALPDTRTEVAKYLDEIAPAAVVGRLVKFSKDGQFITADAGEPISDVAEFVVLADETL